MKLLCARLAMSLVTVVVSVAMAAPVGGQEEQGRPLKGPDDPIKLETTLVQVPVVVSDIGGRYVTDLTQGEFSIYEDGVRQDIEFFGAVEEPFTVALLIDSSGSTAAQLEIIKSAALAFIDSLRSHDRVMVISFNDSVQVLSELTNNREALRQAVGNIQPGEYTQVYEAVYTAVWEKLQDIKGRKAVILFTDGIDTASSEISEEETLDAVVESEDIIVYPIRYATRQDVEQKLLRKVSTPSVIGSGEREKLNRQLGELDKEYRMADEYLQDLATLSGGVVERADRLGDLKAAFGRIAEELRRQYVLGYYPKNKAKLDSARKITVRVSRPGLKVRARPGYRDSGDTAK